MFAIIGVGPNNLEIPLVLFGDKNKAEEFLQHFPVGEDGWLSEDFSECTGEFSDFDENDNERPPHHLYTKLFKEGYYYPGCGGVYRLVVREVAEGEPIVQWDLD